MEKRWMRHYLFWIAYLAFEIYTEYLWIANAFKQFSSWEVFLMCAIPETTLVLVVKIPLVYGIFYSLKRFSINSPNKCKLIGLMVLTTLLFTVISQLIRLYVFDPYVYASLDLGPTTELQGYLNSFMDNIFVVGVAIALKQYFESQRLIQREQLLVKEKIETELNFLKSQINPHFLFNTLNNIYSLARKKSDNTPDVVLKLSKLLRFILYETSNKKITIEREIQFLTDYIELEKIRYDQRLKVDFRYEIDNYNCQIAPLLLIPFVENAFKHGVSETVSNAFVNIELKLKNGFLDFSIANSIEPGLNKNSEDEAGIGLRNLRRQLEILYSEFTLEAAQEDSFYKARLTLDLNENEY